MTDLTDISIPAGIKKLSQDDPEQFFLFIGKTRCYAVLVRFWL